MKAILVDFDGTLVRQDILDVACQLVGMTEKSRQLNQDYLDGKRDGLEILSERINLLKGVYIKQIHDLLDQEAYLRPGAKALFRHLRDQRIISILHSGNIVPILSYYQQILGIDYLVGSNPDIENGQIMGMDASQLSGPDFKLQGSKAILGALGISGVQCIALGDSMADKHIFDFSKVGVAVYPKGGIEEYADYTVTGSLRELIPIIKKLRDDN